jgi:hypothetical protein
VSFRRKFYFVNFLIGRGEINRKKKYMGVFWVVATCCLLDIYRGLGEHTLFIFILED